MISQKISELLFANIAGFLSAKRFCDFAKKLVRTKANVILIMSIYIIYKV